MLYRLPPVPQSRLAPVAQRFAYASVPLALGTILATRAGKLGPEFSIGLITLAAVLAVVALAVVLVALIEIWHSGRLGMARLFRASVVASVVLALPAYLAVQALRLPAINDVSTDLDDPPVFSTSRAVVAAREGIAPPDVDRRRRAEQLRAYPGVKTVLIEAEPAEAYQNVIRAVRQLKWRVIEEVHPEDRRGLGRIEAIEESRLMRFRDDITIRLRWNGTVTRVDIRSASRVGRHDFGANAARIGKLISEIANPSE